MTAKAVSVLDTLKAKFFDSGSSAYMEASFCYANKATHKQLHKFTNNNAVCIQGQEFVEQYKNHVFLFTSLLRPI
jgi:hypothetical protein